MVVCAQARWELRRNSSPEVRADFPEFPLVDTRSTNMFSPEAKLRTKTSQPLLMFFPLSMPHDEEFAGCRDGVSQLAHLCCRNERGIHREPAPLQLHHRPHFHRGPAVRRHLPTVQVSGGTVFFLWNNVSRGNLRNNTKLWEKATISFIVLFEGTCLTRCSTYELHLLKTFIPQSEGKFRTEDLCNFILQTRLNND